MPTVARWVDGEPVMKRPCEECGSQADQPHASSTCSLRLSLIAARDRKTETSQRMTDHKHRHRLRKS